MTNRKYPAIKDRRDIGKVVSPIEIMMAAREVSTSCIGVKALLEVNSKSISQRLKNSRK